MTKRRYTQVEHLLPEVKRLREEGYTQREIAEALGLANKEVVGNLLQRERIKEMNRRKGIFPRPKGRQAKESPETELKRLRMENQLLRDFLQLTERK